MKNVINHVSDPDEEEARKGVIAPEPVQLDNGSYIYRFASHTDVLGYHASPWWIRQDDFEAIMRRASQAGVDLGQKARWDLAVLTKWNLMDVAVEARLTDTARAWSGLAKPQQQQTPNGKVIQMFGNRTIKQLYLCGVVTRRYREDESRMPTERGRRLISVTGAKVIPSSSIF